MLTNTLIYKTVEPVVAHQKLVTINHAKVDEFAASLSAKDLVFLEQSKHFFRQILKYISDKNEVARFLFVFNAVCFCFWAKTKEEKWNYYSKIRHLQLDGSEGLMFCFLEAYRNGKLQLDGEFLSTLTVDDFVAIVGDRRLPLLERRVEILQDIGRVLVEDFSGDVVNFLSKYSTTEELISDLVAWFPSYMDASVYENKQVLFLKRAQLFVHTLTNCLGSKYRLDTTQLTVFADYKLPQMLVHLGLFSYSDALAEQIANREEVAKDSVAEIAIRACTIHCCRLIREKTKLHLSDSDIGDILWHMSQKKHENPYHLTRTDNY